jgi:Transposase IS116/IS110/IS902 family
MKRASGSGGIAGRWLLSVLIGATPSSETPIIAVFLDFSCSDVATASFLRKAVIGYCDYARLSLPNFYPAVANLPSAVAEELEFFGRARCDALWCSELDEHDADIATRLIGEQDPARFRRSCDVAAHFGLSSKRWQSGESIDIQGRILKAGDPDVRRALYEAASAMLSRFKGKDKVKAWTSQGLGAKPREAKLSSQSDGRRSAQIGGDYARHVERWGPSSWAIQPQLKKRFWPAPRSKTANF